MTLTTLTTTLTATLGRDTLTAPRNPHGRARSEHKETLTPTLTTLTRLDPHVFPPLFMEGETGVTGQGLAR